MLNDEEREGNEDFIVMLTNPQPNAELAEPTSVEVIIVDDDDGEGE